MACKLALTFLLFTLVATLATALPAKTDSNVPYTNKWDNIDLDQILASDRLLKNYVDCLLDKKRCTPDGQDLKKILPDALATDCTKCNQRQKDGAEKVVRYLIKNKKNWWSDLEKKYDPSGDHRVRHPELYD